MTLLDEWSAEQIEGHLVLLGFLQIALEKELSPEALDALRVSCIFEGAPYQTDQRFLDEGLAAMRRWAASAEGASSAALDFRMLFEGPEKPVCPPWESAFLSDDQVLFQKETVDVQSFFRRHGFAVNSEINEPADHIAYEIAFCALLLQKTLEARKCGQEGDALASLETLSDFFARHLAKWGISWAQHLSSVASSLFYRGIGLLLEGELADLAQRLA